MKNFYRVATASLFLLAGGGALMAGCGDETDAECEADGDCSEVSCPDGSKVRDCRDGVCFVFEDCEDGGGW